MIALSALLQQLPFHPHEVRSEDFRNANGVARKTADIATHHPDYPKKPTKGNSLDRAILSEFLDDPQRMHAIAAALRQSIVDDDFAGAVQREFGDEDDEVTEGRLLQRKHFVRERDPKIRERKIREFLKTHASVHCEACAFDFQATYGEHGSKYIEVHHVRPLHDSGETKTRTKDLILLCSNCHRMIHRRSPWLRPDQLRDLLASSS